MYLTLGDNYRGVSALIWCLWKYSGNILNTDSAIKKEGKMGYILCVLFHVNEGGDDINEGLQLCVNSLNMCLTRSVGST